MSTATEDQKKISLLEEYVSCLERENFAKNGETSLLYQQLQSLKQENQMLKSFIETTQNKWEEEKQQLTLKLHEKQEEGVVFVARNYGDQLRNSVDIHSLKAVAQDMKMELQSKESQLAQALQQKNRIQNQLHSLKQQLKESTNKALTSQQKLRNKMQYVKQLQNQIFGLKNSRVESRTGAGISFAKLEVDKLVKQNNDLIEKLRYLQKQKNGYYNELKMASPLKSRISNRDDKSAQKRSQCLGKSQRRSIMQEKLRAIRNQNEQLKANLAIL